MQLRVLGSSAGGGFPQWNCNCPQCDGVRHGRVRATPRTQSSVAVSAGGLAALRAWQQAMGMPATGVLDEPSAVALAQGLRPPATR